MLKLFFNILIALSTSISVFSQNYSTELLQEVNTFLETFDDGYYGSIEITDGYFIKKYKSGEYSKAKMSDLNYALVDQTNRKVSIKCWSGKECVYSTYTDEYHDEMNFSQAKDFDTKAFSQLLNDLLESYNGEDIEEEEIIEKNLPIDREIPSLKDALQNLNKYLETFDDGYYGYFEIIDGDIYERFQAGKYNRFDMWEMGETVIQEEYKSVLFKCKDGNRCIFTDWKEDENEEYMLFSNKIKFNYQELADLLEDFKMAYLKEKE